MEGITRVANSNFFDMVMMCNACGQKMQIRLKLDESTPSVMKFSCVKCKAAVQPAFNPHSLCFEFHKDGDLNLKGEKYLTIKEAK